MKIRKGQIFSDKIWCDDDVNLSTPTMGFKITGSKKNLLEMGFEIKITGDKRSNTVQINQFKYVLKFHEVKIWTNALQMSYKFACWCSSNRLFESNYCFNA